ncbi:MAG: Phosphoribosylformylglycinamidine synthase 1 [Parcubacteria group bacterium GW2011_GWB1_37_13]|nr:MAG: Phosphoribosylformylglycinamidine synthase 1 [Parcubacteria group bacterium GW2011_GWB1_37_13]
MKKNINRKPKIIIMSGYGLNCEEETKFVFESAGGTADIIHINDLIAKPKMLLEYQILVFLMDFKL